MKLESTCLLALTAVAATLLITGAPLRAYGTPHNAGPGQHGTDILHLDFSTAMTNTDVDPNAGGSIDWSLNRQGNADNQQLSLSLTNLDSDTAYQLVAFLGDDTNSTDVAGFNTDQNGAFKATYTKRSQRQGHPNAKVFPAALDPLCNIRELDVVNGSTNPVLMADLTDPDQGQYLVKRSMDDTGFIPGAGGELRINATLSFTQFRLQASGLTPDTAYWLTLNGDIVQTNSSDRNGRLKLMTLPEGSPDVLDIHTVTLTSTGTNVVLISTGLGIPCYSGGTQGAVALGAAANFAVLAGSEVANTGPTAVNGDLGLSPGSAVTGFPPGVVNGTQHVTDPTAAQAKLDLTTAYNDAAGRTVAPIAVAGNLGGMTLPPGLYKSTGSLEISSGDLTLDAQGDANAVWIFQIASTLITTAGRQVILSGGAQASNVFWQVGSSATLGTTTVFKGTIMADQAITLQTGATLDGRALARIAAVTLDTSAVTVPTP